MNTVIFKLKTSFLTCIDIQYKYSEVFSDSYLFEQVLTLDLQKSCLPTLSSMQDARRPSDASSRKQ